ncbi:MAG TPA: PIN domain-containing protein [Methylococcaceae bacterium]|nr:PIN domain-containing protein [Methylococcaceae bacterium]
MSGPVLDACALIALLRNEPGADRVAELLEANPVCAIGAVNLAEVLYDAARHDGQAMARSILADIRALPIEIVARVDDELLLRVAEFKSRGRLSLADAFALGLAASRGVPLATADHHEFDVIEKAGLVAFEWIR